MKKESRICKLYNLDITNNYNSHMYFSNGRPSVHMSIVELSSQWTIPLHSLLHSSNIVLHSVLFVQSDFLINRKLLVTSFECLMLNVWYAVISATSDLTSGIAVLPFQHWFCSQNIQWPLPNAPFNGSVALNLMLSCVFSIIWFQYFRLLGHGVDRRMILLISNILTLSTYS